MVGSAFGGPFEPVASMTRDGSGAYDARPGEAMAREGARAYEARPGEAMAREGSRAYEARPVAYQPSQR